MELLKGTEASTKNIFGRYSSQRMKASVGDSGNVQLEASSPGGQRLSDLAEDPVEMPPCNISSTFSLSPYFMPKVDPESESISLSVVSNSL